jgi:uncharacterized protein YwgA
MNDLDKARLSLIATLAEKHPQGCIGRTALMKLLYFLQVLKGVPLGYNFSIYSYGPFDSEVLSDLGTAEAMNIVSSEQVSFSGGYGYHIKPSSEAPKIESMAVPFLQKYKGEINWVLQEFGDLNSSQLELKSTAVYVDQEFAEDDKPHDLNEVVERVGFVKPRFGKEQVINAVNSLKNKGFIKAA